MDTSSLVIRPDTSDSASFRQIFIEEELAPINLPSDALILDCGAYVGYSSFYLLSKFPSSRVLAVEPDRANFRVLRQNLSPFSSRTKLHYGGVWDRNLAPLVRSHAFRDGREWSRTFEPATLATSGSLLGITIRTLINVFSPLQPIDLLKMDIEGAETLIFSSSSSASNDLSWLDRINTIAIELHDDSPHGPATPVFLAAVKDRGFELSRSGELTIATRRRNV